MLFQAVLDSSYDSVQEAILFTDSSDYVTNDQASHTLARFDANSYYVLKITKPDSSTYTFSNQSGASFSIPSASLNILDSALVLGDSDTSGTYTVTLYSIPSWSEEETYNASENDTVAYDGFLWQCENEGVTSEPIIGSTDWTIISVSSVNAKYYETDLLAVTKSEPANTGDFYTTFVDSEGILGIEVDSECSQISITDNSNYSNAEVGHGQANFSDYRFIRITKPNGEYYYMSSIDFDDIDVDQTINPADAGGNTFYYQFNDDDKDGVYVFEMCNYPTWDAEVAYENDDLVVVFYNGELYRLITDSTGNIPSEVGSLYWELYELDNPEDEYTTRYCTCARIAVLCINTYKCYQELTRDAFCAISEDFCNDDSLCKNKKFLQTIKLRILIDEIGYAVNRQAWNEVVDIFNLIYNICGCR